MTQRCKQKQCYRTHIKPYLIEIILRFFLVLLLILLHSKAKRNGPFLPWFFFSFSGCAFYLDVIRFDFENIIASDHTTNQQHNILYKMLNKVKETQKKKEKRNPKIVMFGNKNIHHMGLHTMFFIVISGTWRNVLFYNKLYLLNFCECLCVRWF